VQPHGRRDVSAQFDGGLITSDAGGLLLREVESRLGIIKRFATCFTDFRDEELTEFSAQELLAQRVMGLALGYEDLNDHESLRNDPMLALLVGREDLLGEDRFDRRDRGHALAGKSTLNRLELTGAGASEKSRYKKVVAHHRKIDDFLVDLFLQMETPTPDSKPPTEIVLDVDATDDPVHGHQLGRFFQGYYKSYCYLPLYIFCGEFLLCAKLRPSDIDGSAGCVEQLARIVVRIRQRWPQVRIVVRGDSGFCRERTMRWCEENHVDYLFGLAKNARLKRILGKELEEAKRLFEATGEASRVFKDFTYKTRKSWSRERRVVGKAEHLHKGANPRFVVTSLSTEEVAARELYEQRYCARGDMENRIKEQQLMLFADRTSTHAMRSNQLRLYLSSVAYMMFVAVRRYGLADTPLAKAQCDTIRTRLFKIGARIRVTVRKVWVSLSESYPLQTLFARILANLRERCPNFAPT
jgi:hypothetical protein